VILRVDSKLLFEALTLNPLTLQKKTRVNHWCYFNQCVTIEKQTYLSLFPILQINSRSREILLEFHIHAENYLGVYIQWST
jgi:hypothetical protein